jgi:hypothetical protein
MAGSYSNSLTNSTITDYTIAQSGTLADGSDWAPIITSQGLYLTTNYGGLLGSIVLPDLDSQQVIQSFTAKFQLLLDGAADGFAFAFGPDITDSVGTFQEIGPSMPSGGLTVAFDLYNNGTVNDIADFIGVSVYMYDAVNSASVEYGAYPMTLSSTDWKDVTIQLNRNGTLDLTYGGTTIYSGFSLPGFTDVYGQFAFGARTGGSSANQAIRNLSITTTLKASDLTASITTQPASVTVIERGAASFKVGFDGTPPFTFQWYKNGTAVADATNSVLALSNISAVDNNATFKCDVANSLGTVTSSTATLSVTADTVAPTVVSITSALDLTTVTLVFSEAVTTATAEKISNYAFDNNLSITSASLDTNTYTTVVLTTSAQTPNKTYTLTINGVKDTSYGANPVAAGTKVSFLSQSLKVVGAGAIQKNGSSTYDLGVSFNMPYDEASAKTLANYTLSGGTASAITAWADGYGVVLTTSGLAKNTDYTVVVSGVKDKQGNLIEPSTTTFRVSALQWGVVGANTLGLGNGVVGVGTNGFDVYSDGSGEWGTYDEATLVYEEITGDFDKRLRVEFQDSSSQWARAGLIARDVTNFGVDSATQTGTATEYPYDGKAGRYQKVHVNPVLTAMGTAGNNTWEGNRRTITGGPTTTAGGGGTPAYPNAWCRLKREGQTFSIYRSDDGVNWTLNGTTTWPDSADTANTLMPDKLYVGIDYSPEEGNVTDAALQRVFVAKFRDYGDTPTATKQPAELGTTVNGFQDDFTSATRDPNWVAVGPSGDTYLQGDGVLKAFASTGDPNHLLYMGSGASNTVNEVLARIRVVNFSSGDPARGGIAVNVSSNVTSHLGTWTGINLNYRNTSEGTPATVVHLKLLDDLRQWGPQTTFAWTNNVWYWMRLRQEAKMDGTNSVFAKVWAADGATAEPSDWQLKWADSSLSTPQHGGFAGITGCSGDGTGQLEVDYVLIKSPSLPSIKVAFDATAPSAATVPIFTGITGAANGTAVTVNWFGKSTLQSSTSLNGTWTDHTNLPPWKLTGTNLVPQNFFRLKQ